MSTTFIKTGDCKRMKQPGGGKVAEILSPGFCGAKNILGMVRWLDSGERLDSVSKEDHRQLFYVMDGRGVITLETKDYDVAKGADIYPCPS
jgi:hypothetical protein